MEARIVADPAWGWWIMLYFYFGGIAAGAYFIGTLIDLFGIERDRPIAKLAFTIAAPLAVICGLLLIIDLSRPERFWHMLIQSNTGWPMFKYWSPMSVGAWALLLFGGFASASFVGALAEDGRFGLGRLSRPARYLHEGPVGMIFQGLGCLFGFFIASYTGVLLTTSNQPFWSDSPLIGALFLASAASTGVATLLLIVSLRPVAALDSVANLERTDRWAMLLELFLLIAFVLSLGGLAPAFIGSIYGIMLIVGTLVLGVIVPLVLSWRTHPLGARSTLIAAILVLVGGLVLRYSIVMAGQHVAVAGR